MTERLRELLDSAVVGVTPRVTEPAAEVLRRSRARSRRLSVVATAVGVLAVTGGVTAVAVSSAGRSGQQDSAASGRSVPASSQPAAPDGSPPVPPPGPIRAPGMPPISAPHQEGDRVVSGGFSIGIPSGWTVVGRPPTTACVAPRTVTIGWAPHRDGTCPLDRVISVEGPEPGQVTASQLYTIQSNPAPPVAQFAVTGGEPAYVGVSYSTANPFRDSTEPRTVGLTFPWTGTYLTLNVGSADLAAILATIRTDPVPPGPLGLHADAVGGYLVPASDQPVDAVTIGPAAATRILERLRSLTDVVPAGQECGSAADPATALYLFPSQGAMLGNDLVVITESATCAQATSAEGGRVRVPPGLVEELRGYARAPV